MTVTGDSLVVKQHSRLSVKSRMCRLFIAMYASGGMSSGPGLLTFFNLLIAASTLSKAKEMGKSISGSTGCWAILSSCSKHARSEVQKQTCFPSHWWQCFQLAFSWLLGLIFMMNSGAACEELNVFPGESRVHCWSQIKAPLYFTLS